MRTVRSKKELEEAIKAGEPEVIVEGMRFKLACKGASKVQKIKRKIGGYAPYGAISENTALILVVIATITGLAIIAMCKKYNVEIDYLEGKMKIYYNK